jgi:hypothetical protein
VAALRIGVLRASRQPVTARSGLKGFEAVGIKMVPAAVGMNTITRDRNASQKHAWRAAIILSSADGVGTNEIMRRTGAKTCVWRWQERFMKEGIDGLLHDKTRPSRIPPLGPTTGPAPHRHRHLASRVSGVSKNAFDERE